MSHKPNSGQDLDYLRQKRNRLLEELHSNEHYDATETIAYGAHDPFEVPASACEKCQGTQRMIKVQEHPARWSMQCQCGNEAKTPRPRPWEAALEWNAINLSTVNYRALPLFGLSQLSPEDAHKRLVSIRENLELRRKITGLSRSVGQRTRDTGEVEVPGKTYQQRLSAYLAWCMWALRLTKLAKLDASN